MMDILVAILVLERNTTTKQMLGKTKTLNWGLAYRFRGLVYHHHDREHGTRQAGRQAWCLEQEVKAHIETTTTK